MITGAQLIVGNETWQYSATVPAGLVISQTPPAGTLVLPATAVNLVISRGVQQSVMPGVVGQTRAQAEAAIVNAGLALGVAVRNHSATVAPDNVMTQSPAAGTSLTPGTVVSIVVSIGPAPVPEGEGEPVGRDAARQQLAASLAAADTNGDGALSFDEAVMALPGLDRAVFSELDTDGDGQLSEDELGMNPDSGCAGYQSGKSAFQPKRLSDLFLMALGGLSLAAMSTLRRP
jgi:beta-lactam-binding protein with PASTA domain